MAKEDQTSRPRLFTRSSSSLHAPWSPQLLSLCVVRVSSQCASITPSPGAEIGDQTLSTPVVEFSVPPLDSEASILSKQQLVDCGRLVASSLESSIASNGNGLCFKLEDESDEAADEDARDEQEDEEIFSREMQAADAESKGASVFFCLPKGEDTKRRAVVGIAFADTWTATRQSKEQRLLMLLLTPNETESLKALGGLRAQLRAVTGKFFAAKKERDDFKLLEQFYKTLEKQQVMADGLLPSAAIIRRLGGSDVVATLHALMLQGRVVCYSASTSVASAAVIALLAMLPSQMAHSLLQERDGVFSIQPCCDLKLGKEIFRGSGGYLVGTSCPLLLKTESAQLDLVLDLDAGEVTAHPTATSERAFAFGTKTSALADGLTRRFTDPVAPMHMHIAGQRTRDNEWVLAQCQSYFEKLLEAELTASLYTENADESDSQSTANSGRSDLFPASFRWMLEEIAAPVIGSFVHVDDVEPPDPRSAFCAEYGWSWTLSWQTTSNYTRWLEHELHQRRLTRSGSRGTPRTVRPPPQEGHAAYTYPNGDEYEGEFVDGKREGFGVYVERTTGNQYDGTWLKDERHGRGILTSKASGGYIYDGEWVHDMRCGQGHSTRRGGGGTGGGESYTGQWRANRFHGRGVYVNNEGDVYDGEWCDGVRHGAGKVTVADPVKAEMGGIVQYVGEWVEGKFHGIGLCKYADGSEYSGAFKQGRRHGNGVLVLASGDRYEGQWWQGLRHSQGVAFSNSSGTTREGAWKRGIEVSDGDWLITFANGDKYSGACRRGRPWGKGTCKFANGAAYTGEWVDGLREGHGTCVNPDGTILEGEWKHSVFVKAVRSPSRFVDVSLSSNTPPSSPKRSTSVATNEGEAEYPMSGAHRYVYPNGDVYEGEFQDGHRHGFGIFTEHAMGNTYEGQWIHDLRHGSGVLTSGSKDFIYDGMWENDERCGYGHCVISGGRETYSGQWRANAFHGTGKYTDAEGSIYEGEFVRGKKHGVGKFITPIAALQSDSSIQHQTEQYSGEWSDGCREGLGDAVFADGSRYSGQWKDDLQEGEGTFTSTQGDRYVGQWHRGCREGAGVLTSGSSGVIKEGQWCHGEPMDGEWTITFPDGSKFTGECVGGRPHGRGLCKYAGGDLYDGMWVQGKRHGAGSGFFANGESFVGQWENNHVALSGQGRLTLADGTVHVYDN